MRIFGTLGFCASGNHATENAYEWGDSTWCPSHRPPPSDPDPLLPGFCEWHKPHFAKAGVRWMPPRGRVAGRFLCRDHYREFVQEIIRRGFWHRT